MCVGEVMVCVSLRLGAVYWAMAVFSVLAKTSFEPPPPFPPEAGSEGQTTPGYKHHLCSHRYVGIFPESSTLQSGLHSWKWQTSLVIKCCWCPVEGVGLVQVPPYFPGYCTRCVFRQPVFCQVLWKCKDMSCIFERLSRNSFSGHMNSIKFVCYSKFIFNQKQAFI